MNTFVKNILQKFPNMWLIGSYLISENYNDIDMIIPNHEFGKLLQHLRNFYCIKQVEINKFGGIKFTYEGMKYDVWNGSVDETAIKGNRDFMAYNPHKKIYLTKNDRR